MNEPSFKMTKEKILNSKFEIIESEYHSEAFGSWYISINSKPNRRIVWDGKENWLLIEEKTDERYNNLYVWKELWISRKPPTNDLFVAIDKIIGV